MKNKEVKGIYIHVPFCTHICAYCDFCKILYNESLADGYLKTTIAELESAPYVQEFDIEKDGKQQLTAVMTAEAGIINVTITDANGTVVHETSAKEFFGNLQLELPAGHYTLKAEFTNPDGEDYTGESPVVMSFMILQL